MHTSPNECGGGVSNADSNKGETKKHHEHQGQRNKAGENKIDHIIPPLSLGLTLTITATCLPDNSGRGQKIFSRLYLLNNLYNYIRKKGILGDGRTTIMIEKR